MNKNHSISRLFLKKRINKALLMADVNCIPVLLDWAYRYHKKQSTDVSIRIMEKIVFMKPNSYKYWYIKGTYHYRNDEYSKALSNFLIANKLHPTNKSIQAYICISYFDLNLFDDAIAYMNQFLYIYPDDSLIWFLLGLSWKSKGVCDKALMCFNKSLEYKTQNLKTMDFDEVYHEKANLLVEMKAYHEAITSFQAIESSSMYYKESLMQIGILSKKIKRYKKAISTFKQMVELFYFDPISCDAWFELGEIYILYSKFYEAIFCFEKSIEKFCFENIQERYFSLLVASLLVNDAEKHIDKIYTLNSHFKMSEDEIFKRIADRYLRWESEKISD